MNRFIEGLFCGLLLACLFVQCAQAASKDAPYNQLRSSIVKVYVPGKGGGTGFLTSARSGKPVIITNEHVCALAGKGGMQADKDSEFEGVPIAILGTDIQHDLCVLTQVPGIVLKIGNEPTKFQPLFILGHPFLKAQTPSEGYYIGEEQDKIVVPIPNSVCPKGFDKETNGGLTFCTRVYIFGDMTAPVFPGNSGSPVVDYDGYVIGVVNSMDEKTGYGAMVQLRFLKAILGRF